MRCTEKEQETCEFEKRGCEGCIYNEKSADEMFEELGYKLYEMDNGGELISHYEKTEDKKRKVIRFWNDKSITISGTKAYDGLTFQELQAIYQKCKEMRWIQ